MTCFLFSMCFGGRNFAVFANFSLFWQLDAAAVYFSVSLASVTVFDGSSGFDVFFWLFPGTLWPYIVP